MSDKTGDWLTLGLLGFGGGIVANIIIPARRGVYGFLAAAIIGVFSGGVAGMMANAADLHPSVQYLCAASIGVLGDRLLSFVMTLRREGTIINNNNYGNQQQNVGQDGNADFNKE